MHEEGISLISIVITIIVIILLATIVGVSSVKILKRAEENNIKQEFRNVEELVGTVKGKVMAGSIDIDIPENTYVASNAQIDQYSSVLDNVEIESIKSINTDPDASKNEKYHLMNQEAFDTLFKNEINVKDVTRSYLINFKEGVVILNLDGKLYKTGEIK